MKDQKSICTSNTRKIKQNYLWVFI